MGWGRNAQPRSGRPHLCSSQQRPAAATAAPPRMRSTPSRPPLSADDRLPRHRALPPLQRTNSSARAHGQGPRRRRPPARATPAGILRRRRGEGGEEGSLRWRLGFRHPSRPPGATRGPGGNPSLPLFFICKVPDIVFGQTYFW